MRDQFVGNNFCYLAIQSESRPSVKHTWTLAGAQVSTRIRIANQKALTVHQRARGRNGHYTEAIVHWAPRTARHVHIQPVYQVYQVLRLAWLFY